MLVPCVCYWQMSNNLTLIFGIGLWLNYLYILVISNNFINSSLWKFYLIIHFISMKGCLTCWLFSLVWTGKSTLLNSLFCTNFTEMDAFKGRHVSTTPIHSLQQSNLAITINKVNLIGRVCFQVSNNQRNLDG